MPVPLLICALVRRYGLSRVHPKSLSRAVLVASGHSAASFDAVSPFFSMAFSPVFRRQKKTYLFFLFHANGQGAACHVRTTFFSGQYIIRGPPMHRGGRRVLGTLLSLVLTHNRGHLFVEVSLLTYLARFRRVSSRVGPPVLNWDLFPLERDLLNLQTVLSFTFFGYPCFPPFTALFSFRSHSSKIPARRAALRILVVFQVFFTLLFYRYLNGDFHQRKLWPYLLLLIAANFK